MTLIARCARLVAHVVTVMKTSEKKPGVGKATVAQQLHIERTSVRRILNERIRP